MKGYKSTDLCAIIYKIFVWLAKTYTFKVLVGSNYKLNRDIYFSHDVFWPIWCWYFLKNIGRKKTTYLLSNSMRGSINFGFDWCLICLTCVMCMYLFTDRFSMIMYLVAWEKIYICIFCIWLMIGEGIVSREISSSFLLLPNISHSFLSMSDQWLIIKRTKSYGTFSFPSSLTNPSQR